MAEAKIDAEKVTKQETTAAADPNPPTLLVMENKKPAVNSVKSKMTRLEDVSTIFILGSKSAGKSTIINRILEKTDIPKPTLALDFTFARRTVQDPKIQVHSIKEVCHIWELGGDAITFSQLIETPIKTNHALDKFAIFLVLDLSVPEKIWPTLDTVVSVSKRAVTRALTDSLKRDAKDMTNKLDDKIIQRLGSEFPDKMYVEPFPLPIVMIGTKYDVFQEYEPEKRKNICRILRLASHRLGASLHFFSKNDVAHTRRVRELFTHYAFGTPFPKGVSQDPSKPIFIPHGADTFDQIWPGCNPAQFSMEYFKHIFETSIGKYDEKLSIPDDPAEDPNFREAEIDSRRNVILEDLTLTESIRKEYYKGDSIRMAN